MIKVILEIKDHKVYKDPLGLLDHKELLGLRDLRVTLEIKVQLDLLDHKGLLDHKEKQGPKGVTGGDGPQGISGNDGADGNGIVSATNNGDGTFTLTFDDETTFTTDDLTGPQGPQGPADPLELLDPLELMELMVQLDHKDLDRWSYWCRRSKWKRNIKYCSKQ